MAEDPPNSRARLGARVMFEVLPAEPFESLQLGNRHDPTRPNPGRSGRALLTITPTRPAASFSGEFSPRFGRIPALNPTASIYNILPNNILRQFRHPASRDSRPVMSTPWTSDNGSATVRFCVQAAGRTRPNPTKTPRMGGRPSGCAGPRGPVVRNEGVGSNLPIETNVGAARHLLPFRLAAPGSRDY